MIVIFALFITVPTVLYNTVGENVEKIAITEKRTFPELPKEYSEFWFLYFQNWYADHAPYRQSIISAYKTFTGNRDHLLFSTVHPALSRLFRPAWYDSDEPYISPLISGDALYGKDDWLFYTDQDNLEFYKGTNILDDKTAKKWKNSYIELDKICKEKGITVVFAVFPNKEQVYPQYMPSFFIENDPKRLPSFAEYVRRDTDLKYIYPLEEIKAYTLRETYLRQDTHWNSIGAALGVSAIYKELKMPEIVPDDWKITETERRGGDISNFCGYFANYTNYDVKYKPEIKVEMESISEQQFKKYTSNSENDRTLFIIGDSFRVATENYLSRDFKTIYSAHYNHLDNEYVDEAIADLSEGDVIIVSALERMDKYVYKSAKYLCEKLDK